MLRTATALADRGHDVRLVTARDEQAPNNRPDPRLRYRSLGRHRTRAAVPALARHLRDTRPDVVLTAMDHANVAGLVAVALSRTGVPVVVSFRMDVVEASRRSGGARGWIRPRAARLTMARAARVVAVSEGVRAGLVALAPASADKVTAIYNPTVHDRMEELAAEPVVAPPGVDPARVVLAVGRLSPSKGFDVLLRAFAQVAPHRGDLHLVVLGEGPLRGRLESQVAELGLTGRVHLPGYAANPYAWFARCRLVAFSSRWEGMANVLVEAGSLGAPIVATDCPSGPRELLEGREQATLVAVDDVDALADALAAEFRRPRQRWEGDWSAHTVEVSTRRYEEVLRAATSDAGATCDPASVRRG